MSIYKIYSSLKNAENLHASIVSLTCNQDASGTIIRRFKKGKYHPYKVHFVQNLLEDNCDRRLKYCEELMRRCNDCNGFRLDIIFSDEVTFYLNEMVKTQLSLLVQGKSTLDMRGA